MLRQITLALLLSGVVADAIGQTAFRVRLSGDQAIPVSGVAEPGEGLMVLDPGSGRIHYSVDLSALATPATAVGLHRGAPGEVGSVLFALAGGPSIFEGESAPLAANDIELIRSGSSYVHVATAAHPSGALRGQVCAAWSEFLVDADGATALPPSGSAGTASGILNITDDGLLQFGLTTSGLSSPLTGGTLRRGSPGADLGLIVQLPARSGGGPSSLQGVVGPLTEADQAWIRSGSAWLTVATQSFPDTAVQPGGELRGVARPWQYPYGEASGPSASSTPMVLNLLPWRPGGLVDIYLLNESLGLLPYQFGWLLVGPAADVASLPNGGSLLVDLPGSFALPVPTGAHNIQAFLPAVLPPPTWLQLQFVGADAGGTILSSRGVAVRLNP